MSSTLSSESDTIVGSFMASFCESSLSIFTCSSLFTDGLTTVDDDFFKLLTDACVDLWRRDFSSELRSVGNRHPSFGFNGLDFVDVLVALDGDADVVFDASVNYSLTLDSNIPINKNFGTIVQRKVCIHFPE